MPFDAMEQPFVGRESELALLAQDMDGIAAGLPGLTIVRGDPGIGKTSLLAEATRRASARGLRVFSGSGYELGLERPFRAIADALGLRPSAPDLARRAIGQVLQAGEAHQHVAFRIQEDILSLLERESARAPIVLAVDDLQWVDSPSLETLAHVVRHAHHLPILFLLALRSGPVRPPIEQLFRAAEPVVAIRWLDLGPLSRSAVDQLLASLITEPDPRLRGQVDRAGGNPFFVREIVQAVTAGDAMDLSEPLSQSFVERVRRRLGSFPPETDEALRMAAALGPEFSLAEVAAILDRTVSEVDSLLRPLRSLVLDSDLRFRHELLRDVVYDDIAPATRADLHQRIGGWLAGQAAPDPVRVATHLSLASATGHHDAVRWLQQAARVTESRSPVVAVELLDRALSLVDADDPIQASLRADRAVALMWCGQPAEAAKEARSVLAEAGPTDGPRLRLALAQAQVLQGSWAEAAPELETLAADPALGERLQALALADAALGRAHGGEVETAISLADAATSLARRLNDDLALSVGLSSRAVVTYFEGRFQDSVALSRQARALVEATDRPESRLRPTSVWLGLGLIDTDRFEEARQQLLIGRREAEEAGVRWQIPLYHDGLGTICFYTGDWDDAAAEMETCLSLAEECGTKWWVVPANCFLAYIALHRDEHDRLAEALAAAEAARAEYGGNRLHWVSGLRREAAGDLSGALGELEEGWAATEASGFRPHYLVIGPDYVRIALAAGETDRAERVAARVEEVAQDTGSESAQATADRCRGLAHGDPARLRQAVDRLTRSQRRVELAFALEELGNLLAGQCREEAIGSLERALDEYRRFEAKRDIARISAQLRSLGVRVAARPRAPRPAVGWEALTQTELRVVELARKGLSNPEIGERLFISRRTVATHLGHVFEKLGVSSRIELAGIASRYLQ